MTTQLSRRVLTRGVGFSVLRDPKFKFNRLSVNFIVPLEEETASDNAMLVLMMRRGCRTCPDFTEFNRKLYGLYGAELSGEVLKLGANQVLSFSITMIDDRFTLDSERLLRECALLLRDVVTAPNIEDGAFPATEFEVERQYLIDTIEAEINDKRTWALAQCRRIMGRGDAASRRKYGTVEGARSVTPGSTAKAWEKLIADAGVEIFYTGSGDPTDAEEVFADTFAAREHESLYVPVDIVPAAEKVQEAVERLDVVQSKLVLGFRTGERPPFGQQAAIRLAVAILGGTPSSKLFLNVREKRSLCYYCSARYDRLGAIMMVESGVEHQNVEPAQEAILAELEDLRRGIFTDETMEETRLQLVNSLRAISDSSGSIEDWYLNRVLMGEMSTPQEEIEQFERVTRGEVVEAAKGITLDTVYLLTQKQEDNADEN